MDTARHLGGQRTVHRLMAGHRSLALKGCRNHEYIEVRLGPLWHRMHVAFIHDIQVRRRQRLFEFSTDLIDHAHAIPYRGQSQMHKKNGGVTRRPRNPTQMNGTWTHLLMHEEVGGMEPADSGTMLIPKPQ